MSLSLGVSLPVRLFNPPDVKLMQKKCKKKNVTQSHLIKNGMSVSQRARIRQKNQPSGEPNLNLTKKKRGEDLDLTLIREKIL